MRRCAGSSRTCRDGTARHLVRSPFEERTAGTDVTAVTLETVAPVDVAPVAQPKPVPREEYVAATCPLCLGGLWQRIRGLFCPRCKGWLVEETHGGRVVHSLWQGRP
jgi:hypothetical protein